MLDVMIGRLLERYPDRKDMIVARQLRPNDADLAIGVFPVDWLPVEDSYEMAGRLTGAPWEPTLSRYTFRLQVMVKDTDDEQGRRRYGIEAKNLRSILYRDQELPVRLRALKETDLESVEQVKRYGIRNQRYLNNEMQGIWLYLAVTDLWIETETHPV